MENNEVDAAPPKPFNEDKSLLFDVIDINGMCEYEKNHYFVFYDIDSIYCVMICLICRQSS